ncbi:MAG: nucleotidyltransferase domain-containing protein [Candidatus Pacearchaeota archaeon]
MEELNSKKILKRIQENESKINKLGVKKIGLFGSFAKKKQKKRSDIDILVSFRDVDFDKYIELQLLLEKIFKRKIDLVIEEDLRPELEYIKKEAKYVRL